MDWAKTTARWYKKHLSFVIWCDLYKMFYGNNISSLWSGSLGYLCNIRVEPTTNCNSNETYAILFQIYSYITY